MTHRSSAEFAGFYSTTLLKELKVLDGRRKEVLRRVWILFAVTAGIILVFTALSVSFGLSHGFVVVPAVLCAMAASFLYRYLTSGYVHQFKLQIIERIVHFIDPDLVYWPNGHISRMQFVASRIFERNPDRMHGDDHVQGKVGVTRIEFSEVHAEYKTETVDSRGRRQRRWHTIFKGLFFVGDFNKKFYGKTVVLPDTAEKIFGGMGSFFQKLNRSRGELIKLEDPEFERHFVVYGDDQIESRYVLSTSLMKRIVDFKKKTGKRVYLSFVGSEVFVAISYRRALFEPKVFTSITSFKNAQEYFEDLQLALDIVEDLNLNTRIWTKRPVSAQPSEVPDLPGTSNTA